MDIAAKDQPCFFGQLIGPPPGIRAVRVARNGEGELYIQVRKNEVMRIFIFRKRRAKFRRALNERASEVPAAFTGIGVGLLDCPHDQRSYRGTGPLGQLPQPIV
jgi:hypothetical protein